MLGIPGISSNPLAQRVIDIFDDDGGGDVDFKEFLMGLSAFSAKGQKEQKLQCESAIIKEYSSIQKHCTGSEYITSTLHSSVSGCA
jgi:hypothetical protein